jgi:diguanylate cyclase (GGDEF)-like protein
MKNNETDCLTGLYSRSGLYSTIETLTKNQPVSTLFIDIDNFKSVNDSYGHAAGDEVLITVGNIIKKSAMNTYAVRMGGDEFLLVFSGITSRDELITTAEKIFSEISAIQEEDEIFSVLGVSIGIAENITDGLESAIEKSDFAMYHAKETGKNKYVFYNSIQNSLTRQKELTNKIKFNIESECFNILLFPLFDINTRKICQFELHVVWNVGKNDTLYASDFRPVMEKNGLSRKFDLYTFSIICKELSKIACKIPSGTRFSLLISIQSLLDAALFEKLRYIMDEYSIRPDMIDFAVSEEFFDRRDTENLISHIHFLSGMGFSISLIDLGENFYSLKYIRYLPVCTVKLSPDYLKKLLMCRHEKDYMILQFFVKLLKGLDFVVAGVEIETQEQLETMKRVGFDCAEGSVLSEPILLDELQKVDDIDSFIKKFEVE